MITVWSSRFTRASDLLSLAEKVYQISCASADLKLRQKYSKLMDKYAVAVSVLKLTDPEGADAKRKQLADEVKLLENKINMLWQKHEANIWSEGTQQLLQNWVTRHVFLLDQVVAWKV